MIVTGGVAFNAVKSPTSHQAVERHAHVAQRKQRDGTAALAATALGHGGTAARSDVQTAPVADSGPLGAQVTEDDTITAASSASEMLKHAAPVGQAAMARDDVRAASLEPVQIGALTAAAGADNGDIDVGAVQSGVGKAIGTAAAGAVDVNDGLETRAAAQLKLGDDVVTSGPAGGKSIMVTNVNSVAAGNVAMAPEIPRDVDVRAIRDKLDMTQEAFAQTFGLSIASLRNWQQGTRTPGRPIALYLRLIDRFPEQVQEEVAAARGAHRRVSLVVVRGPPRAAPFSFAPDLQAVDRSSEHR